MYQKQVQIQTLNKANSAKRDLTEPFRNQFKQLPDYQMNDIACLITFVSNYFFPQPT